MTYAEILTDIIAKSGMTLRQIADKCGELGNPIDPSYLSKLQTAKLPPASDIISETIALAVGADPQKLVWQGYVEKAPIAVQPVLKWYMDYWDVFLKLATGLVVEQEYRGDQETLEKRRLEIADEIRHLSLETQLEYIIHTLNRFFSTVREWPEGYEILKKAFDENLINSIRSLPVNRVDVINTLGKTIGSEWVHTDKVLKGAYIYYIAPDDSMAPLQIRKGTKVLCRTLNPKDPADSVVSGKVYQVWLNDEILIRRVFLSGDKPTVLQSDNPSFPPITVSSDDIFEVWGIVESVEFNPNEDPPDKATT